MKKRVSPKFALLLILAVISAFPAAGMRINEIMYNPEGDDNNQEFVEIFMDNPQNLSGWIISDSSSNDNLELIQRRNSSYALVVEQGFDAAGINASVYSAGATIGNNLHNTADEIFFYTPESTLVASAQYDGSLANGNGYSMELVKGEWLESADKGGTPGMPNTAHEIDNSSNETDRTNQTNSSTNTTNQTDCSIFFEVSTGKSLYNNSEKVKINLDAEPGQEDTDGFFIEYWVEDLAGNIAKSKYNTTNTNQKSWTPNIDEEDKSFYVKADLHTECDGDQIIISSEKLITVRGTAKPTESSITIKEIYLGSDESIEFGKSLRVKLEIYKGDESSSTVQAWIEDLDSSERISDISKLVLYEKFREYELTVPVQIKNNCDRDYNDGSYTLVIQGLNLTETEEVKIEGVVSSLCPESSPAAEENAGTARLSYELDGYNEEITVGKKFTTKVSIQNGEKSHRFTMWSYVYRGSKCYSCRSGERADNQVTVNLGPGETHVAELDNMVEEAEPGDYKFKVKIKKDDQKTTRDLIREIEILSPPMQEENRSINFDVAAMVTSGENKTSKKEAAESGNQVTGKVVYRSSSAKAKSLAPYFIIAAMAVMILILALRSRNKPVKRTVKQTQKL